MAFVVYASSLESWGYPMSLLGFAMSIWRALFKTVSASHFIMKHAFYQYIRQYVGDTC